MRVGDLVRYTYDGRIGIITEIYGLVADMAIVQFADGEQDILYGVEMELLCR